MIGDILSHSFMLCLFVYSLVHTPVCEHKCVALQYFEQQCNKSFKIDSSLKEKHIDSLTLIVY